VVVELHTCRATDTGLDFACSALVYRWQCLGIQVVMEGFYHGLQLIVYAYLLSVLDIVIGPVLQKACDCG
jgi:hypothetical protein